VLQDLIVDDISLSLLIVHVQILHLYIIRLTHVITGDLNIINNTSLRDVVANGSKYREPIDKLESYH